MSSRAVKILSLFLAVVLPSSLLCAETHAAMVFANGMASLNGTALSRTSAIFAGDILETSKNSGLIINANGSTVQVGANSRVQFQGESIDINSGTAQVTTNNALKVQAIGLTVSPMNRTAKYQVTRNSGKLLVAALNGSVAISNGKTSDILTAGEMKSFDDQEDKDSRKRDRGAVVYTSDKQMFIWGATALAAGGVIAWWLLRDDRKPLSNQLP